MGSRQDNEETRGVLEGEGDDDEEEEQEEEERREDRQEEAEQDNAAGGEVREGERDRPPSYQDAFFFPVLIIHGEESCHAGDDM